MTHTPAPRIGWPAPAFALLAVLHVLGSVAASAALPPLLETLVARPAWVGPAAGAWGVYLLALGLSGVLLFRRSRALPRGTRGRARLMILPVAGLLHALATVAALLILAWTAEQWLVQGLGAGIRLDEMLVVMPLPWAATLGAAAVVEVLGAATVLAEGLAAWFLVDRRKRAWLWAVLDVAIVAAFVYVTLTLPLEPPPDAAPEAMLRPGIRLAVTVLFGLRLLARLVPPLLGGIEQTGFHTLVAARHLRARKSSFLAAIGTLSVLAVGFSSCSLTTTLSVMGGFRQDLKDKILGNNAHVAIGKEHETFEGWEPLLERVQQVDGVEAANPFVSGEVMVTSASNLAGAVIRGVDPGRIGKVTDLEANLVRGKLRYLVEPERLLDLPPEERRGPMPLETGFGRIDDEPVDPAPTDSGPIRDVDELLGRGAPGTEPPASADGPGEGASDAAADVPGGGLPTVPGADGASLDDKGLDGNGLDGRALDDLDPFFEEPEPEVLPGIIVGQELARTLRLFVGDEVNVVSPFGGLGPTGPMPKSRPFRVAGIFYSGMYEYDMKYTYVTLESAQRFLGTGDAISGIEIRVNDVDRAPGVAAAIEQAIDRGELPVLDWQELNQNLFGALELEKLAMFITLGIAVLVAGFCVFGTLTLMVQEKGREVAILRAMGSPRRSIVSIFLIEGLLIGLFGAAIGLGLGFVVCYAAEHFGIRMNPEVYYIDKLPVHVDGTEFGLVGIAAAVVCLTATIFPAVLASRMSPVEQLRYE